MSFHRQNPPGFIHKIRVERSFKKDIHMFYVFLFKDTYKCKVRRFSHDDYIEAEVQPDLKTILLSEFIKITSLDGETEKMINKLTIPKDSLYMLKEL
jgi:hypothetical protein